MLPLSTLYALFIGMKRGDAETRTRISGITVRKIVNNWFKRYKENKETGSEWVLVQVPVSVSSFPLFFVVLRIPRVLVSISARVVQSTEAHASRIEVGISSRPSKPFIFLGRLIAGSHNLERRTHWFLHSLATICAEFALKLPLQYPGEAEFGKPPNSLVMAVPYCFAFTTVSLHNELL